MTGRVTDREFLRAVLADGRPHNLNEILRRSLNERGCGLTVHSRAAELRAAVRGEGGDLLQWRDGQRGDGSWYRLLLKEEAGVGQEARDLGCPGDTGFASSLSGGTTAPTPPVEGDTAAAAHHQTSIDDLWAAA